MKTLKKLLAIASSVCLLMSFMSMTAFASNTGIGLMNANPINSSTPINTRYVYRALQPQVKLNYYHHYGSSSINSLNANDENNKPYKTECYNYVNGKYVLAETTYN
ncbi:hypothetical protein [Clostridium sp. E02]|uniref:hypothetical protein n=1 Tax=Clostridium sp. E02 TaxID=2487134 RepID=UPI000F543A2D|nr:hypothetical protein [Clostridium sp. E02]